MEAIKFLLFFLLFFIFSSSFNRWILFRFKNKTKTNSFLRLLFAARLFHITFIVIFLLMKLKLSIRLSRISKINNNSNNKYRKIAILEFKFKISCHYIICNICYLNCCSVFFNLLEIIKSLWLLFLFHWFSNISDIFDWSLRYSSISSLLKILSCCILYPDTIKMSAF